MDLAAIDKAEVVLPQKLERLLTQKKRLEASLVRA